MSEVVKLIEEHHREFLRKLSAHVESLDRDGCASTDLNGLVALLTDDLLPHAMGEERHLYPVVDELVRRYGRPTAPMSIDHQAIEAYVGEIEAAAGAFAAAAGPERSELEARLKRLARELYGLVVVHTRKEESVFLPLVEKHMPKHEQERLLRHLHHSYRDEDPDP